MRVIVIAAVLAGGCVRDPAPPLCPGIEIGALAVTEVRAAGTGDTQGSWVELFNSSGHDLDIRGLELRFRSPSGSPLASVLVRRSLPVAANDYVVLGLFPDDSKRPAHVDYGLAADFHVSWPSAAALDLNACDTLIDRLQYTSLPTMGTYSYGPKPPVPTLPSNGNDIASNWCTDATMAGAGTPQGANPPCP